QFTWNDLLRNEPLIGKFMDAEKAVASGASSADIAKKLFDFGKEALKTDKGLQKDAKENGWAKAVGSHYCPNDLKDLNPAIDINYRDSKTVGTSQTTGPASIDRGDVTIKANDGVVLKNGMQVKAQGDLDIDTPELLLKAAELLSQCKSHNSKLGIGVTAQGQFVDASVAFDCTQQKGVTYENSGLTSARTVNLHHGDKAMDKAVLDGANIEGDRVAGGIESLLVTTKQDVNKSTSYQTSANTKGDVSVGYAHSSSRKANEISGIVGHQGIGEDLQIGTLENTGGSFTSENEVDLHPKQIINKELKEKDKHISAGLSGNVNDFIPKEKTESSNNTDMAGKEAEPKPPKVHVKVDYKDKRGRRQATVFGSEGTKITSDSVIGEMNQDSADGYKKDRDWHIKGQGTVLVPCKESLEYAKYKYDETKEKIEKTVQTIKETKEKIFPAKPKGGVSDAFQPAAELIKRGSINEHPGQTPSVTSVSQSFFHDPLAAPSPASILLDDKVPDISLVSPSEQSDQYPLAVNPDCAGISLESDNASTYVRGTAAGVGIATGPQYTLGISSDALNTAYAFDKQLKPGVGNIHNLSNADKGMLGEMAGARDLISGGYEMFPSKLPSNQGFDGVFIKKGSGGEIAEIVILESKATKNIAGRAKLGSTTTKGVQCSPEWYSATLNEMAHSPSKSVRDTAELLMKNESKVTLGCNTLSPKGNSWGIANLSNKPAEFLGKSADATIAAEAKSVGAIKAGKYAKRAGKVCVVAGAGLDAYEVYGQFAEDRKTGDYSKTYKTVSTKAWSWTGAIACAELGASIGAGGGPIGAAVCGTLGGIAGAIGGEKAAEVAYDWAGSAKDWVSDIFKGNVEDDIQEASVTALTP
ncbi:MAG: hypothetical protein KAS93_07885, partial [Gammaproteobacteria bacterium]|nr:hypothetical protein [Gammaproteobacteria bacterium]